MVGKLNATIGKWKAKANPVPPVPQPNTSAKPGVYLVHKAGVNQGRVRIGHLGVKRPFPDEFSLRMANGVLGGLGFTSWMTKRVRSEEGLAYSVGSRFRVGNLIPGTFMAAFQSKSSTCARAAQLTIELIKKIRKTAVSQEELTTIKNYLIDTFPRAFESKNQVVSRYATDELTGLPHEFWKTYRDRVRGVSTGAARRAAATHIKLDQLMVLVVGDIEEILKGHPDHPEASFETFGELIRLPLRDPFTLQPLPLNGP